MDPIKKELVVEASQETSFKVFTEKIDYWWPKELHVGKAPLRESILEAKPAGRWYSTHEDGSQVTIGYIITWDPYGHLVLAWQINGNFVYDPDLVSEIEVNFIVEGPTRTRVQLEHRDLDKLQGGTKVIEEMDQGWSYILSRYQQLFTQTAAI
jgi:hypothetical protein